jgi:hypothetical protein
VWWVERDIPPYDKYQCATYRVYMVLEDENQPFLAVQSGVGIYPVVPLTGENLNRNVAKAGQDPPVIISRTMGEIHD